MIITAGELLVEFVSHQKGCGLTELGPYSGPYPSGAPAIFIDQAARMGARTAIYGGVGRDGFGAALLRRLEKDGVGIDHVTRNDGLSTGTAFVSYFEDGRRTFIFHLAETAADAFDVARPVDTEEPLTLHVSGSSLGSPFLRRQILALVERVLGEGGQISFDPNVRPELLRDDEARSAVRYLTELASILLPSESDLEALLPGMDRGRAVVELQRNAARVVVVKLGADGCLVSDGSTLEHLPGLNVNEVDPTGAGDCFCGTFVALLEQGFTPRDAAAMANAAGALSVTVRGPMEGNSTRDQLHAFLEGRSAGGSDVDRSSR